MRPIFVPLIAVVVLIGQSFCLADDDHPRGRRLAVVVGNNEYLPDQGLDTLGQAVNDAHRLSESLRNAGFIVIEMTHDVASVPGKRLLAPNLDYIRKQIDGILDAPGLGRDDAVLISLHGHGVQYDLEETVKKNGKDEIRKTPRFFFCPADASIRDPKGGPIERANDLTERNHLLALDELYQKLEGCTAATKLLIVDACRNDPTRSGRFRSLESKTLPKVPPPPGGIAAFFSCKANQRAVEDSDLGQGVFTHFLVQGLNGKADQPLEDAPPDGIVTLSELTSYVANNTYSYVLNKYPGEKQSPDMKGEYDTNLPLVRLSKTKPQPTEIISNATGIKLKLIPAGEFEMGSRLTEKELAARFAKWNAKEEYFTDERPAHRVKISRPFYLGQYEVTVGQFRKFVTDSGYKTEAESDGKGGYGWVESKSTWEHDPKFTWKNPGFTQTDDHPVVNVTWNDAKKFCEWLSRKDGQTYGLPTEAQWEYACKAGTNTLWSNGDDPESVSKIGNIADGTLKAKFPSFKSIDAKDGYVFTAPVGKFAANSFGLYDMHGNASEWCEDVFVAKLYTGDDREGTTVDPQQSTGSEYRGLRGGAWRSVPRFSRSANRSRYTSEHRDFVIGFRISRTQ